MRREKREAVMTFLLTPSYLKKMNEDLKPKGKAIFLPDEVFKNILSYCDDTIERKQKKHMKQLCNDFKTLRESRVRWYKNYGGKVEGMQTGAPVWAMQTGGMVPTMLEPGEKVFSPGSYGQDIMSLNKDVPRFGGSGSVNNISSSANNHIKEIESIMDRSLKVEQERQKIIVAGAQQQQRNQGPAPQTSGFDGGPIPMLPDNPGNAFQQSLVMTKNLLSANIGG